MELVKKNKKVLSTVRLFMHVYGVDGAGCGTTNPSCNIVNANINCSCNNGLINE